MKDNRIEQTSVALTGPRQTPKNDFGDVLVHASKQVASTVAPLVGAVVGGPVMTAAVGGISAVTSMSTTRARGAEPAGNLDRQTQTFSDSSGLGAAAGSTGGQSEAMEVLQLQAAIQADSVKMNAIYMGLQREMQRESREYTALSNIMKVRHDTAKSAINNVR